MPRGPELRRRAAPDSDRIAVAARQVIETKVPLITSVQELQSASTYRAAVGELLATFMFVFLVTGCPVLSFGGQNVGVQGIALNFGLTITVLAYVFGGVSGCHVNPAVTWSQVLSRRMSIVAGSLHVVCQLIGAVLGSAVVEALAGGLKTADGEITAWELTHAATNYVRPFDPTGPDTNENMAIGPAFLGEALGTAILVWVVMAIGDDERNDKDAHNPVLGPLAAGLAVFAANVTLIPLTNCSINPARTFGPAVMYGARPNLDGFSQTPWSYMWLFWLAPLAGSSAAAIIWQVGFSPDDFFTCACCSRRKAGAGVEDWGSSGRDLTTGTASPLAQAEAALDGTASPA